MPHHVFVVEDHPVMRAAYRNVLALEPDLHLCGEAETAEGALDALDAAECDVVVADVRLPGMDGIGLVRALRERRPGLPVLVVSAHEADVYAERARAAGAVGFLPKRGLAGALAAAVRAAVGAAVPVPLDA